MFDQTFVDGVGKTNKGWTVLISALIQFAILAVLIVIPLVFYSEIGQASLTSMLVAPAPPPPPPPPPPPAQVIKVVKVAPRQFDTTLHAPKTIPKQVAIIVEAELPPAVGDVQPVGVVGGFGPSTGVPGGVLGGIPPPPKQEAPPPPPPKPEPPKGPQRVSSGVIKGNLLNQVKPNYPAIAKSTRTQGTVRLSATIGKDGHILNLQVVSGPPMLQKAALDAVNQWVYKPYLLNGEPVEVLTEIEVNFALN